MENAHRVNDMPTTRSMRTYIFHEVVDRPCTSETEALHTIVHGVRYGPLRKFIQCVHKANAFNAVS